VAGKDWMAKEKILEQAKDIQYLLSNMNKYLNKIFIKVKGGTYYPQIIMGLMEPNLKSWKMVATNQTSCVTSTASACRRYHLFRMALVFGR